MSRMILSEIHKTEAFPPKSSSVVLTIAPLNQSDPSSSSAISVLCLVISVVALIIVFLGILHLIFKFLQNSQTFYQIPSFNPNLNLSSSSPQLQHLFLLHNSGLDQTAIDALPVFHYGHVTMSLKEPFDCAVCLSEFSDMDKLRLLPVCSHAFHLHCIDTWLLSNSSCPLCRRSLSTSNLNSSSLCLNEVETSIAPLSSDDHQHHDDGKASISKRVFSVRLGRFKSTNATQSQSQEVKCETGVGVVRRCYSMGTHQYLECHKDFMVSLSSSHGEGNSCSAHKGK